MANVRLDKFLAQAGIGTRTQVKDLLKKGKIRVNGETVKKPETKVDEEKDEILFDGEKIGYEKTVWYMLNKPAGYLTATKDKSGKTVMDLLPQDARNRKGLFPVGRLDIDTEGLLLFTDDGDTAHRLLSPVHHVDKTYLAVLDGLLGDEEAEKLRNGLDIGDEKITLPARISFPEDQDRRRVLITIQEGRFHQVKRMFHAVGREVTYLKRMSMGTIVLDPNLELGESRRLTQEEADFLTKK